MTYEPTVWATGDKITADKLNKLEDAVVSADEQLSSLEAAKEASDEQIGKLESAVEGIPSIMLIHSILSVDAEEESDAEPQDESGEADRALGFSSEVWHLDKTYAEIKEAIEEGKIVFAVQRDSLISSVKVEEFYHEDDDYYEYYVILSEGDYVTNDADGQPTCFVLLSDDNGNGDSTLPIDTPGESA